MKSFELAKKRNLPKRFTIALAAQPKCGKTHFALTAPGPIAYFNLDMGDDHVLDKFIGKKEIYVAEFKRSIIGAAVNYKALYKQFRDAHKEAVRDKDIRTIIWDTESEAWEIARLAHFGRNKDIDVDMAKNSRARNYGPINAEFAEMIRSVEESDKNMIVLQQLRQEYINEKPTDNYVPIGYAKTGYMLEATATAYFDKDEEGGFWIEIEKNRLDMGMCGDVFEPPEMSFPHIAAASHGNKVRDWK